MSEKRNYPDFYIPSGDRQTPEKRELEEVEHLFNEIFDDIMLQNMDEVIRFGELLGIPPAAMYSTHLDVDNEEYSLYLKDTSTIKRHDGNSSIEHRDSEIILREISLQRIESSYGRENWSYRLGSDGVVRRWDGGDQRAKNQKERELGIKPRVLTGNEDQETVRKLARRGIQELIEYTIPNSRLEEDMGLNKQPVALAEMQGLKEFLDSAEVLAE